MGSHPVMASRLGDNLKVRPVATNPEASPLAGTPSGGYAAAALAWCAGIALVGYLWLRATFSKRA
jgi:hypothetical protein